jgi:hypothetical protein
MASAGDSIVPMTDLHLRSATDLLGLLRAREVGASLDEPGTIALIR